MLIFAGLLIGREQMMLEATSRVPLAPYKGFYLQGTVLGEECSDASICKTLRWSWGDKNPIQQRYESRDQLQMEQAFLFSSLFQEHQAILLCPGLGLT